MANRPEQQGEQATLVGASASSVRSESPSVSESSPAPTRMNLPPKEKNTPRTISIPAEATWPEAKEILLAATAPDLPTTPAAAPSAPPDPDSTSTPIDASREWWPKEQQQPQAEVEGLLQQHQLHVLGTRFLVEVLVSPRLKLSL